MPVPMVMGDAGCSLMVSVPGELPGARVAAALTDTGPEMEPLPPSAPAVTDTAVFAREPFTSNVPADTTVGPV